MTPLVLANQAHAHGSRLKDNKDQEFIIVSIVATHPFWNDLKNGAQDAADGAARLAGARDLQPGA